jgi:hypothetical protein
MACLIGIFTLGISLVYSIVIILFNDQVEDCYENFEDAQSDQLFEKGWIPEILVYNSMTDIYQRTNLDLNTCIFSFKLSESHLVLVNDKLELAGNINMPKGISLPNHWLNSVEKLSHYYLVENGDTIYVAVNIDEQILYGWRNGIN